MEKTLQIHLEELRERIAKEIEDGAYAYFSTDANAWAVHTIITQAVDIARGVSLTPQPTINDIIKSIDETQNSPQIVGDATPKTPTEKEE